MDFEAIQQYAAQHMDLFLIPVGLIIMIGAARGWACFEPKPLKPNSWMRWMTPTRYRACLFLLGLLFVLLEVARLAGWGVTPH